MKIQGDYLIYMYVAMVWTTGYVLSTYLPFNNDSMVSRDAYDEQLRIVRKRYPVDSQEWYMHQQKRDRRSNAHPNCGKWSTKISRHTPTMTDRGDFERPMPAELEAFCPYRMGGQISDFQCSDERGEPFKGTYSSPDVDYRIDCSDVHIGANCTVLDVKMNFLCPDISIQYKCSCVPPPLVTTTASMSVLTANNTTTPITTTASTSVTAASSTTTPSLPDTSSDVQTSNVRGLSISWWIVVLILSCVLFLFNVLLTVILYKKAVQQTKPHRKDKVQPMTLNIA